MHWRTHHPQGSGPQQLLAICSSAAPSATNTSVMAVMWAQRRRFYHHAGTWQRSGGLSGLPVARPDRTGPSPRKRPTWGEKAPARESSVARNLHSSSRRASYKHQAIVLPFLPSFECDSFSRRRSAMKCSKGGDMILEPRNCDHTRHERCLRALVTSAFLLCFVELHFWMDPRTSSSAHGPPCSLLPLGL